MQDTTVEVAIKTLKALAKLSEDEQAGCTRQGQRGMANYHQGRKDGYLNSAAFLERALEQEQRTEAEYHEQVRELRDRLSE